MFASVEDSVEAMMKYNNQEIDGRKLKIEYVNRDVSSGTVDYIANQLFVGQLASGVTKEQLEELFTGATLVDLPIGKRGKKMKYVSFFIVYSHI